MRLLAIGLILLISATGFAQFSAYTFPRVTGNQWFGGALGMDFDVNQDILITALGIFDSGQNGIQNNIDCYIYDRDTRQVVASRFFSPTNMGLGDGTSNFLDLAAPIRLRAGFHGSIVAQGFGILERNGNSYSAVNTFASNMNTGGGLISFTGRSRNGDFGAFPTNIDMNVAQYGAGNFKYRAFTPVPEPATLLLAGLSVAIAARRKAKK